MTEKEAFKAGFLSRCAEEQLTGDALAARIHAADALVKSAVLDFNAVSGAMNAVKNLGFVPLGLAAMGGGLAGHVAGTLAAPDLDEEDVKARELAAAYKAYAARAKTNRKLRLYRPER
jgi:hypothetical protein